MRLSPFHRSTFRALSVILCVLLIGAFIPTFKVIGTVIVTDEGLYTSGELGQPFNRIGPEQISIGGIDSILTELHIFLVADFLVYVEYKTIIEQPPPVRTITEDGVAVTVSGILIAPTVTAYQFQEPVDRQHSEGSPLPAIEPTDFVCMPPSGRLRVIHV